MSHGAVVVVDLTQDSSGSDGDGSAARVAAPSKRARRLPVRVWVLVKSELPGQYERVPGLAVLGT